MLEMEDIECVAGHGICGDRFFDHQANYKGQITFFATEVYEALRIIRTLALVALGSDNEKLSTEELAILQQQTLNRIVVVTDKALAKAPR